MQTRPIPSVSVVMPAYNAAKYIAEAIDSILAQTYTDFEFIIINDGSADDTEKIIRSYDDPRIVYLKNEVNSGICVTLNKGLDAARGRYIARMDADDISLPQRLAVQVQYMDTHPDIGALGSDIEIFGEDEAPHIFTQLHTPEECKAGLLFNSCFAHPSVMLRRNVLESAGLRYKGEYRGLEDYELWWQICKSSKLNNIAQPLLRYRQHKGQETRNVTPQVQAAFFKFAKCRFSDLNIPVSDKEFALWMAYAYGEFEQFDDKNLNSFITLSGKILRLFPDRASKTLAAVKLTLSQGITYILSNSKNVRHPRQFFYNRALVRGVFPLKWYVKVAYHNFIR